MIWFPDTASVATARDPKDEMIKKSQLSIEKFRIWCGKKD